MTDIKVADLRAKVDKWLFYKKQIKDIQEATEIALEPVKEALTKIESELIEIMDAMEIKKFEGSLGKITLMETDYVNQPQGEDAKQAFFTYLKDQGIFEEMVSVHYQKLNSFFKTKLEEAIEKQEELNIPGLEPKTRKELRGYKL